MNDCIDRRTGSAEAFLCDDANQAYRRAHDEASWRRAHEAAMRVVSHLTDQRKHARAVEWREQAMTAYWNAKRAARAAANKEQPHV
ncbi:MAG: hypothetical protein GY838_12850 [bacterium]|nr:hypothetical protein [bacterium]